ncbi:MAG: hypothetical protein CMN58_01955 [Solibacterales bacterium]|nr:hypothetical protein [Bryobacterales bacterium]|tara:strand:+ start:17472 stop:18809 length:1338 start_codon:yes stop_codon:yes gene_type:complete
MQKLTRRYFFLGTAAATLPARPKSTKSAANKVVLALIGAGGRGDDLAQKLQRVENVEFKYVCEVNDENGANTIRHLESVTGRRPKRVLDMRHTFDDPDVDGVVITTPEHWHALASVWACQAGKDAYVEKCISLTIWEGRKMIEAARKYKRVVQCGTQNRSAPYTTSAKEYIASGQLGKVLQVKVFNLLPPTGDWAPLEPLQDRAVPAGLDWDAFLGPAPNKPYNPNRIAHWEAYWDYGGGALSSDASHQLDQVRMVLGDPPHPRTIYAVGGRFSANDGREAPDTQVITYNYDDFVMTCESGTFSPYLKKFPNAVRQGDIWPTWNHHSTRVEIYGTKQIMFLGRHGAGWQAMEEDGKVVAEDAGRHPDKWHQPNFIDSIRTRSMPNSDIEQGHYSSCVVHLGNLAYRAGNEHLVFDGKKERFDNNDWANNHLKPAYRKHYRVPEQV